MSTTPRVSIIMPTYNRRDTIGRAIASVQAQRFDDWELIVVDDGSTDGTKDMVEALDPRVRLIVQENRGVAGARNRALQAARGELIAFLDSDDAWTPHHLALTTAFFAAHPEAHLVTTEFWESFGPGLPPVIHPRTEMGEWYPETARRIGSSAFSRPPLHGDPYLWFFDTREELGAWGREVLASTPYLENARLYRGELFQKWRWGWLTALQPTVISREAMRKVGPIDASYPVASDFGWLANLCRHFTAHFISAPGAIKHEYGDGQSELTEAHLVTGRTATQFHLDVLHFHEALFWNDAPNDPELSALRGFRQTLVARAALTQGRREVALSHLKEAVRSYPGADTDALLLLAQVPDARVASWMYRGTQAGARLAARVRQAVHRSVS